jgi:hypothetical protein
MYYGIKLGTKIGGGAMWLRGRAMRNLMKKRTIPGSHPNLLLKLTILFSLQHSEVRIPT